MQSLVAQQVGLPSFSTVRTSAPARSRSLPPRKAGSTWFHRRISRCGQTNPFLRIDTFEACDPIGTLFWSGTFGAGHRSRIELTGAPGFRRMKFPAGAHQPPEEPHSLDCSHKGQLFRFAGKEIEQRDSSKYNRFSARSVSGHFDAPCKPTHPLLLADLRWFHKGNSVGAEESCRTHFRLPCH